MKSSLPQIDVVSGSTKRLLEHRRRMAIQGQLHLERIAASSAGRSFEPLPRKKKATR
jgi:hypothetical protein